MARYIDAEELKKRAYPFPCAIGVEYAVSVRQIDEVPTADVVPKSEFAREIFEEIIKPIYYKIPPKIRPIFRSDGRDFDDGYRDGKTDAFIEVLMLIAELEKKYIKDCRTCRYLVSCKPNTSGNFDCWEAPVE